MYRLKNLLIKIFISPIVSAIAITLLYFPSLLNSRFFSSAMRLIFGFAAPFYDKAISRVGEAVYGAAAREALGKVGEPDKILDISTGTGFLALSAVEKFSRALVFATDISFQMVLAAAKNARVRGLKLNLVLADSRKLPFKDACFELVATHNAPPYIKEMSMVSRSKILACYSFGGILFNFAANKVVEYLRKHGLETTYARTAYGIYFIATKEFK